MASKMYFLLYFLPVIISCSQKRNSEAEAALFKAKGDSLIAQTFDTLRNTLLREIGKNGFVGSVEFCNTNALPITNTYAGETVFIKRTSDKLRNPANAPDTMEQRLLAMYLSLKSGGRALEPVLEKDAAGNLHYFKPIIVQAMCLNCHGDKSLQIQPDTWQVIQLKYPSDAAFGYKEGEVRGMWHVKFITGNN